jgi:hypothetical protein
MVLKEHRAGQADGQDSGIWNDRPRRRICVQPLSAAVGHSSGCRFVVSWAAAILLFLRRRSSASPSGTCVQRTAQHHLPPADDPDAARIVPLDWTARYPLLLLVYAMIKVGVAKEALGLRKGPALCLFLAGRGGVPRDRRLFDPVLALVYVSIIAILLASAHAVGAIVYAAATGAIRVTHAIPQAALGWLAQAAVAIGLDCCSCLVLRCRSAVLLSSCPSPSQNAASAYLPQLGAH